MKTDVLVTVDTKTKIVHLRFGPNFGMHLGMTPDEALRISGLLAEGVNALRTANASPTEATPPAGGKT